MNYQIGDVVCVITDNKKDRYGIIKFIGDDRIIIENPIRKDTKENTTSYIGFCKGNLLKALSNEEVSEITNLWKLYNKYYK